MLSLPAPPAGLPPAESAPVVVAAGVSVVDGKVVTKIEVIATHAFPMAPAPPGPSASRTGP